MKYIIYQERNDAIGYINNNLVKQLKGFKAIKTKWDNNQYLNHIKDIITALKIVLTTNKNDVILLTNAKSLTTYILNYICKAKLYAIFYHIDKDKLDDIIGYKNLLKNVIILTPSVETMKDLRKKGLEFFRVKYIEIPCDKEFKLLKAQRRIKDLIYVGSFDKRKNLTKVMRALWWLKRYKKLKVNLTIVSGYGKGYKEIKQQIKDYKLTEQITIKRKLTKSNLVIEYNIHKCLIYPTLKEGLGLPLIEASKCGCGIITSNKRHHTQITLNKAEYVDQEDYRNIAESIYNLFNKTKEAKKNLANLQNNSSIVANHYKWEKTVKKLQENIN